MEADEPLSPVGSGRDNRGRFGAGNKLAKGNPLNKRTQQIRAALLRAVTPTDIREAAKRIVEQARNGDLRAFSELLDRTLGRPVQADVLERLEALEQHLEERGRE